MGRITFFLVSITTVILGLLLISPWFAAYLPEFLREYASQIGGALLVGAVVSLTVDRFLKAELLAEIARDVLRFTVGYDLPPLIKEEVRYLLRLPFVRREFEMKLVITKLDDKPDFVKVTMLTCFEVENLSNRLQDYMFTSSISLTAYSAVGDSRITRFEQTGKNGFSLDEAEIRNRWVKDDHFAKMSRRVLLPEAKKGTLKFTTERVAYFAASDTYVLDILEPTIGATIDIIAPEGFSWSVYFPVRGDLEKLPSVRPTKYRHQGVFLPGQFISMKWVSPADQKAAAG